jgi:hypothetical protein
VSQDRPPASRQGAVGRDSGASARLGDKKLHKIKRPAGTFTFDVEPVAEDEHGTWLSALQGAAWTAPHDTGTLRFDVLLLISDTRYWVGWWVDDPEDRRVEVDVSLLPSRTSDGWSFVDLELDPLRHQSGLIEIQDEDEFDAACRDGWIRPDEAAIARATADELRDSLTTRQPPFGDEGWQRLAALQRDPA